MAESRRRGMGIGFALAGRCRRFQKLVLPARRVRPCGWFLDRVNPDLYVKLSAGVVYGYKDPYEDRLPVNNNGYGLGIVPALGYQFGQANAQVVFLGTAAVAFTFGCDFWN
jgi:hypothetical protein